MSTIPISINVRQKASFYIHRKYIEPTLLQKH